MDTRSNLRQRLAFLRSYTQMEKQSQKQSVARDLPIPRLARPPNQKLLINSTRKPPALDTIAAALAEHGASKYPTPSTPPKPGALFLETEHLSTSPTQTPNGKVVQKADSVASSLEGPKASSLPNSADSLNARDFATTIEDASIRPTPSRSQTHQYPAQNLLHPSSAITPTTSSAPTAFKDVVAAATGSGALSRPSRRNTTGSSNPPKGKGAATAAPVSLSTSGLATVGGVAVTIIHDGWDPEFDEDMKKQAEQIRRERKRRDLEAQEAERIKEERSPSGVTGGKGKERGHARSGSAGAKSTGGRSGKSLDEWKPIVGNVVGEGHVNYILMYNMLTGIRVAVSRCQAKPPRPLTDADYTAAHKYNFDVIGNEMTPSAKYDFKFKDYAPWVFRSLREDSFNLDPADYLLSLTSKYILSELGSPGKSGSFFYFSRDYRFIIKTIRAVEHKWLRTVLKDYYQHVKDNPHTLISRFYGLHRVKLPRGPKIHFVIMNNLFPAHRDIHETYDLKGSTVGRLLPDSKLENNPGAVMKDLNWINRSRVLEFGPYKRALLTEQLRRDVEFLKRIGVMDYSLLVGLHSVKRGNKENIRGTTLRVFKPDIKDVPDVEGTVGARKWIGIKHAMEVRRAILVAQRQHQTTVGLPSAINDPASLSPIADRKASISGGKPEKGLSRQGTSKERGQGRDRNFSRPSPLHTLESSNLPDEDPNPSDRSGFIFYSDDGGYRATDDQDAEWHGGLGGKMVVDGHVVSDTEKAEKDEMPDDGDGVVYYLGIIDILTRWTLAKRVEHVWKGLKADRRKISPVKPPEYGDRFFSFLQAIMRGGDGGQSFV
ncbi:hypothetical protein M408DRAFT_11102 [Serendipita vermifera MAFF 305830]|uniref:1-phosphatidylinositol-4-phosphate 5-kinase n=1 Tax=Serendipita vermifera MAFF 305830 TaxID=933852 RepID=A0A0C3AYC2_SERVB|nr:hypothetical protein M408DRAFT_11102 [Serendipita vermifera MAFF 305830]